MPGLTFSNELISRDEGTHTVGTHSDLVDCADGRTLHVCCTATCAINVRNRKCTTSLWKQSKSRRSS
jgi:post-segregation antitoxin (ccd killing protein)